MSTYRQVLEAQVAQRLLLRLVHAVRQLREDAVHVLEERAKQHLLPPRLEQWQLQGGEQAGRDVRLLNPALFTWLPVLNTFGLENSKITFPIHRSGSSPSLWLQARLNQQPHLNSEL